MVSMKTRSLLLILAALGGFSAEVGAQAGGSTWDSVARILGTSHAETGGYHRFAMPRRDLTVRIGDVVVAPGLALGSWAGMSGGAGDVMLMGDLVVTADELRAVLAELAERGITVAAIHNHLVGEEPRIVYVHIQGRGAAVDLARRLAAVVARTGTPLPVASGSSEPPTIDTALVFRTLGARGRAQGSVAQVSFNLIPDSVRLDGRVIPAAMGYGTPINLQQVDGSRAVATGDFALLPRQVDPVLDALAAHGIMATALHSHLVGERPTIYYVHFWADGPIPEVLRGLRSALEAAR